MASNPFFRQNINTGVQPSAAQSQQGVNPFLIQRAEPQQQAAPITPAVAEEDNLPTKIIDKLTTFSPLRVLDKAYSAAFGAENNTGFEDTAKAIPGGLYNAGVELAKTSAAISPLNVLDRSMSNAFGTERNKTLEKIKDTVYSIPRYENKDQGIVPSIVQEAAEWAPGLAMGGASAAAVAPKATTLIGNIARKAFITLATEAGGVATANPDTGKLLVGKDSALGQLGINLPEWGINPDGSVEENILRKKTDLLVDSVVTAFGIDAGVKIVKTFIDIVPKPVIKGLGDFFSKNRQENSVVKDLLNEIGQIDITDSPEVVFKKQQEVINSIRNNKRYQAFFSKIDDRMTDINSTNDTLSILVKTLEDQNPDLYRSQIADLNNLRNASKGPRLEAAGQLPIRDIEKPLDQIVSTRGGEQSMDAAVTGITKAADDKFIKPIQEQLGSALTKGEDIEGIFIKEFNDNPMFAEMARKLTSGVSADLTNAADTEAVKITKKLFALADDMTKRKNELFNAIPKEVKGSSQIVKQTIQEIDALDSAIIPKEIREAIAKSDFNLQDMEKIANFDIKRIIEQLKGKNEFTVAGELMKLKKALTTDQLDYLVNAKKKGTTGASKAIKAAHKFYTEEFLPWRENPILDEMITSKNSLETLRRVPEGAKALSEGLVKPSKDTASRIYTDNLIDFVEKNIGVEGKKEINDFATLKLVEDIQRTINNNRLTNPEDVLKTLKPFERYAAVLKKSDPEKFKQLEGFFESVRNGIMDGKTLDAQIDFLKNELKGAEDKVYNGLVQEFYNKVGSSGRKVVPNSYEGFVKLFDNPQATDRISEMINMVKGDPVMMDGIQAAYSKYLKETFFNPQLGNSRIPTVKLGKLKEFIDNTSPAAKYAKEILGEEHTTLLQEVVKRAYDISAVTAKNQNKAVETGLIDKFGLNAINTVITWVWGVLNPTAARIRTITGRYVANNQAAPYIKDFLDLVLSDPDEFLKVADRISKYKQPFLSEQDKKILMKALQKGGLYGTQENEDGPGSLDAQMQNLQ